MAASKYPVVMLIASGLGALLVSAQVIVALTPSKADDAAWEKIKSMPIVGSLMAALVEIAPIKKK